MWEVVDNNKTQTARLMGGVCYLLRAGAEYLSFAGWRARGISFWRDDTSFKFKKCENFIGAERTSEGSRDS